MIGIIIAAIVVAIIIVLVKKNARKREEDVDGFEVGVAVVIGVMLAILLDLCAWGIFSGSAIETTRTTEIVASTKIVALQDNSSLSGSFFLGSGSVNNKNYYAFYCEAKNGFKYTTLDGESSSNPVYIQYLASIKETPHIDRYAVVERKTMTADGKHSWLYSIIAWLNYNQCATGDIIYEESTSPALIAPSDEPNYYDNWRYEIHIPEGSIQQNYTIDLE